MQLPEKVPPIWLLPFSRKPLRAESKEHEEKTTHPFKKSECRANLKTVFRMGAARPSRAVTGEAQDLQAANL
ncbi:hypothetical protein ACSAZL_06335 [Methanosarcina sp. T3]|uniref:hypothetical protein n=1 Tax=Methanosarcina sp. T3 TaxID=3439062 RepID=UPI003F846620